MRFCVTVATVISIVSDIENAVIIILLLLLFVSVWDISVSYWRAAVLSPFVHLRYKMQIILTLVHKLLLIYGPTFTACLKTDALDNFSIKKVYELVVMSFLLQFFPLWVRSYLLMYLFLVNWLGVVYGYKDIVHLKIIIIIISKYYLMHHVEILSFFPPYLFNCTHVWSVKVIKSIYF